MKLYALIFYLLLTVIPSAFAATTTPNLGLVLPTPVPGSWAVELNNNFIKIDNEFPGGYAESTYTINGSLNFCSDAGSDDAYACTTAIPWPSYINGSWIDFRPNTVNTGGATVNVNGLGVRAIVQHDGTVLTNGMLAAGRPYRVTYDSAISSFRMPPVGSGGGGGITAETDPLASAVNGILKSNGATLSAAVSNTDFAAAAHATRHQNGGADEIATATAAANAIPKAGAGGTLAQGWIGSSMYDGSQYRCADIGSNDTYVCSKGNAPTAYVVGMWIDLVPNTTNTATATVNVNSLGAKSILKHDGTALADGDLVSGSSYRITYDGTNFRLPAAAGAGGSGTVTGTGTANKLTKFTAASAIGDSQCSDDGTSISCGDVSGNHYQETFSTPTGTHVHNNIAQSGDRALSTGTRTSGKVPVYDANGVLVDGTALAALKTKQVIIRIGSDTGSALADTNDEANVWPERIAAMTITSVKCWSDAGTPIINLARDDGSAANILSSNLTCSTSGATGTIAGAEDNLATTDKVNFTMVTAGGAAKRVTVSIMATVD